MSRRLLLLRHARAAWAEPGVRDFDRPLDAEGTQDADNLGAAMLACGLIPDRILCSSARRAQETWNRIARHIPHRRSGIVFTDELYSSDATGYLAIARRGADAMSLLMIGHNPMLEDLAFALAANGEERASGTLSSGFPVCGLAVIAFKGSLADAAPGKGYLEAFLTPADS
jgi:phosphohistidine phosphatase